MPKTKQTKVWVVFDDKMQEQSGSYDMLGQQTYPGMITHHMELLYVTDKPAKSRNTIIAQQSVLHGKWEEMLYVLVEVQDIAEGYYHEENHWQTLGVFDDIKQATKARKKAKDNGATTKLLLYQQDSV